MSALERLPRWRCHKVVRAAKIVAIEKFDAKPNWLLDLEVPGDSLVEVTAEWLGKHKPAIGGFFVVYDDGYTSYSPAAAFEAGYTRTDDVHDH